MDGTHAGAYAAQASQGDDVHSTAPTDPPNDLDSPEVLQAPHRAYATLRGAAASHMCVAEGSVVRGFFSYDSVMQVLRDRNFVAEEYPAETVLHGAPPQESYRDSEAHRLLRRKLADGAFLHEWAGRIAGCAQQLLQCQREQRAFCLVGDFAQPLMLQVTAALLATDIPTVHRWGEAFANLADAGSVHMSRAQIAAQELCEHVHVQFSSAVADPFSLCRMLGEAVGREGADAATRSLMVMLAAGHGTTSDMIVNTVVSLLQNAVPLGALLDDAGAIEAAIEEALRLNPSIHHVTRTAKVEREVGGTRVAAGETVLLALASAHRDAVAYDQPDRLILDRQGPRHIAFGLGASYCIGASLARVAIREAVSALARFAPDGRLCDEVLVWKPSAVLRGPRSAHFMARP